MIDVIENWSDSVTTTPSPSRPRLGRSAPGRRRQVTRRSTREARGKNMQHNRPDSKEKTPGLGKPEESEAENLFDSTNLSLEPTARAGNSSGGDLLLPDEHRALSTDRAYKRGWLFTYPAADRSDSRQDQPGGAEEHFPKSARERVAGLSLERVSLTSGGVRDPFQLVIEKQ